MTTAAQPTWAPAMGGNEQGDTRIFGPSQKYSPRDVAAHSTLKPRKEGQHTHVRGDDSDDTEALMAELDQIKKERGEEKLRKEKQQKLEELNAKEEELIKGNPLLNAPTSFNVNRRLYFKGLIREETRGTLVAGFGVAICGQADKILFQMKGSIHDSAITVLEAELMALKRGLTEAVTLGITHISIYCDHYQIFELVKGRCAPEKDSLALLMNDVQRIRQQLTSSTPILVTGDQTNKFAYKLALETLVSEISICMPPNSHTKKTLCGICFNDDLVDEHMFSVASCGHQFCVECLKGHIQIEVRKRVPICPRYNCKSKLNIESCAHLLTPKLRAMWEKRIDEKTLTNQAMCAKCQHVTLIVRGFNRVECRCGYSFCYICGAEWKLLGAGCVHRKKEVFSVIMSFVITIVSFFGFVRLLYAFK